MEYAICLHPGSGVRAPGGFVVEPSTAGFDVVFYRPTAGLADVVFLIEGRESLPVEESELWEILYQLRGDEAPGSAEGTVTDLGNGISEVRFVGVDGLVPLSAERGFVRLSAALIDDRDDLVALSHGPVFGWEESLIRLDQTETFAVPFCKVEVLSGRIDALVGTHTVDVSRAAMDANWNALFDSGKHYHIEIFEGDMEGHRFDVVGMNAAGYLVLAEDDNVYSGPPYNSMNTAKSLPTELVGDRFVLRAHYQLEEFFPSDGSSLEGNVREAEADQIFQLNNGTFESKWLCKNAQTGSLQWVQGNDTLSRDTGGDVIPPGEGVFLRPTSVPYHVVSLGVVRKNAFVLPLATGYQMVGAAYPLDQTPAERGMSSMNFVGSENPEEADRLCLWLGDLEKPIDAYSCYFLLDSEGIQTSRWAHVEDGFLRPSDHDQLFERDRASLYFRSQTAYPNFKLPLPWCINLEGE